MSLSPQHQLAELGYRGFPCVPGGKVPLVTGWVQHASADAAQIELWLEQYPNANWGISTDGLLVIDCDPGAEHWPQDEQQARELAATPVIVTTPRGGRHYYFRQPEGGQYRNTQDGQLGEHVDTRANGGYVAVPPSKINGTPYRWATGEIDVGPGDLPIAPQWVLKKLDAAKRKERKPQGDSEGIIAEGRRNGSLTRLAGAMRRVGAGEADILAAISHVNETRCRPPLPPKDVQTIAKSVARYPPAEVEACLTELAAEQAGDGSPDDPGPLPESLVNVPGFINQVIEWNLQGAFKPQPALALAGALSLLATLTGRSITDSQGTRTNLYCMGVSGTSTGKERARTVNKEILFNACPNLIGSESLGSAQGLIAAVHNQPNILFQLDEFGRYLKTMSDAAGSPHLWNIVSVLMRMFTDSASIFKSDAVADMNRIKTITNPHACVYATTTPAAFYNSLTADALQDGFLSRVLVFEGEETALKRLPQKSVPPPEIVEQAKYWVNLQPGGNLSTINPQPICVESSTAARRIMYELDAISQDEQNRQGELLGSLWPRAAEKANKLALLYACSENALKPSISDAAATWAVDTVIHLTKRLTFQASRWVSENKQERGTKRLSRLIEDAGRTGINKSALTRLTRWLSKRERDDHLHALMEGGEVVIREVETDGRTRVLYLHRKHA